MSALLKGVPVIKYSFVVKSSYAMDIYKLDHFACVPDEYSRPQVDLPWAGALGYVGTIE